MFTAHTKWQLGAQIAAAAGPVGREYNINLDAGGHGVGASASPLFYYVHEDGVLLDVGIQDNFISSVPEINRAFYGKKVEADDIVNKPGAVEIPMHHGVEALQALLAGLSGGPSGARTEPLEVDSVMKKWKSPPSLEFVAGAVKRWGFLNWQSGNDDSVYYNLNIPSFFKTKVCMPPPETSVLVRDINEDLLNLTFFDESTKAESVPLHEYLVGPKQVQAMLMMHKGKVVFEIYPGMNPDDLHVWMSASKTCVGLICNLLHDEGKLDFDKTVGVYVPELKGTAWEDITMKNVMCMAAGLDAEENFESLSNPNSFISLFFKYVMEPGTGDWREALKTAQPIPGEKQGDRFRYSTTTTQVLVLAIENITGKTYEVLLNERVWSKIGAKYPFFIGLAPDNTPVGGGLNVTTPQDFLRYAAIYTPSGAKVVTKGEPIVSDKCLKAIFDMGDPKAYACGDEAEFGLRWFGEQPFKNSAQWDHIFEDGGMFKHGNMGQGIYVDPERDFCGVYFGLATNNEAVSGVDKSPGFLRAAAKKLNGS
jgi:CubicO group peptidase (beta-lactamase class C family)